MNRIIDVAYGSAGKSWASPPAQPWGRPPGLGTSARPSTVAVPAARLQATSAALKAGWASAAQLELSRTAVARTWRRAEFMSWVPGTGVLRAVSGVMVLSAAGQGIVLRCAIPVV